MRGFVNQQARVCVGQLACCGQSLWVCNMVYSCSRIVSHFMSGNDKEYLL